jgi:hypothetical protein
MAISYSSSVRHITNPTTVGYPPDGKIEWNGAAHPIPPYPPMFPGYILEKDNKHDNAQVREPA